MVVEGGSFQWCGGWVFGSGKHNDFFCSVKVSRIGGGQSLWGVVAVYAWKNLEWV